jgi:hypothetical protein
MARHGTSFHQARARTARALLLLPLLPALAGCRTLERMDYLDRFFDPEGYYARHAPTPMAGPDQALLPIATGPPDQVRAMEPRPNPPDVTPEPEPSVEPPARGTPTPEDPELRLRRTVRQHRWLARFWMELTPTEQRRVAWQLRRGEAAAGAAPLDPATA